MAELLIPPYLQFFDENGDPISGGFIYTYSAGTTAPKPTYTDSTASVELSNPIELDSAGRTVMWGTGSYKFVVTDSLGNTIRTVDNVTTYSTIADEAEPLFDIFSGTGSQTVFILSENAGTDSENLMVFVSTPVQSYVTNGNFDTDTDWTKGSGWTIGTGVATATGAISTAISQTSPKTLISGQAYRLTYTVTRSAGGIIPSIGGRNGTERTASGTYTEIIIADSSQTIAFTGNGFTGTIDSVSINNLDTTGYQIQSPSVYTINGTTLTFLTAPPSGTNNIYVLAPSLLLGAAAAAVASAEAAESGALAAQSAAEGFRDEAEGFRDEAGEYADKLVGTSTSSVAIGTGSKAFTTQSGKFFDAGNWLLITSDADPSNYMHGQVTAYSGTSLTVNVTNIGGSGTLADWTIRLSGTRGAAGPAGSVNDGTYGDVTVSSGGTVWTIVNGAVTLAKIQDISTRKILGRSTAGTGVTEQLDFIDDDTMATATATNVPSAESVKAYVDTEIAGIPTPTTDYELLSVLTPSGAATVDIALTSGYSSFTIVVDNLIPSTDDRGLRAFYSVDGGSNYISGAQNYGWRMQTFGPSTSATSAASITINTEFTNSAYGNGLGIFGATNAITSGLGNATDEGCSFIMNIVRGGNRQNFAQWAGTARDIQTRPLTFRGEGTLVNTTAPITNAQFALSSGNITATIYVYGRKNS